MKFNIGDRVICVCRYDGNDEIVGLTGVVCGPIRDSWCGVEYDQELLAGHSCDGYCQAPYGWDTGYECLEAYTDSPPIAEETMSYEELNI